MIEKEKRGKVKLLVVLAVVLIALAIIIIASKSYLNYLDLKDVKEKEGYNEVIKTSDEVAPILSESKVEKLIEIVPFNNMDSDLVDAYSDKLMTIDSIDSSVLLAMAYNRLDEQFILNYSDDKPLVDGANTEDLKYINVVNLDNIIMKDYNTKVKERKDFIASNDKRLYTFNNDYYVSYSSINNLNTKLNKIVNSEEKDGNLFIYEKMAVLKEETNTYYLYNQNGEEVYKGDKKGAVNYFNNNLGDFLVYKHTFNKQDDGYYWYSTEIAE